MFREAKSCLNNKHNVTKVEFKQDITANVYLGILRAGGEKGRIVVGSNLEEAPGEGAGHKGGDHYRGELVGVGPDLCCVCENRFKSSSWCQLVQLT